MTTFVRPRPSLIVFETSVDAPDVYIFTVITNILNFQDQIKARYNSTDDDRQFLNEINEHDQFLMQKATYFIISNMSEGNITVEMLCNELSLGRTVLYSKIKSLTGAGVHEFILSVKLKHALSLLKKGTHNISQASDECGFSSIAHFSKSFSQYFGQAPSEYMKK